MRRQCIGTNNGMEGAESDDINLSEEEEFGSLPAISDVRRFLRFGPRRRRRKNFPWQPDLDSRSRDRKMAAANQSSASDSDTMQQASGRVFFNGFSEDSGYEPDGYETDAESSQSEWEDFLRYQRKRHAPINMCMAAFSKMRIGEKPAKKVAKNADHMEASFDIPYNGESVDSSTDISMDTAAGATSSAPSSAHRFRIYDVTKRGYYQQHLQQ